MIRAVLVVAITAALLGVSMPVVESARVDVAQTAVTGELDRLERAAERLAAENDPVAPGEAGARRVLTLRLPTASWGRAGLDTFRLPANASTVVWAVEGGRTSERRLAAAGVVGRPGGGLEFAAGGRHEVVLELQRRDGEPVVVVGRPNFMGDDAGTPRYARPAAPADG